MTDQLKQIIIAINAQLGNKFTGKYYGICEVVNSQAERYPVTIGTKRDRVSPADTWQLQVYFKVANALQLPTQEEFGTNVAFQQTLNMIVIANVNLGEDFIYRIAKAIPMLINVTGGYSVLEDGMTINTNHEALATADFGSAFEDKHRLVKNIWSVDFNLSLTYCEPA